MHTVCLRSADATELSEGTYRWQLQAANFQTASKAFLASIEPLMSQCRSRGVNRVYLVERLVITPERRELVVREEAVGGGGVDGGGGDAAQGGGEAALTLPLHLNRVSKLSVSPGGQVRIDLDAPTA